MSRESEPKRMRANVHGRHDREMMVSKYSEKLAQLYKAQVELYKLIIEDAEASKIEAAVSRVATLSFELTEMPDIPETVKEWHERIMGKAFPKNAISAENTGSLRQIKPTAATVAEAHGPTPSRPRRVVADHRRDPARRP